MVCGCLISYPICDLADFIWTFSKTFDVISMHLGLAEF